MRVRSFFGLTSFLAAFVLNPAYFAGCISVSDDEPDFKYGAKEMAGLAKTANDSFEFQSGTANYRLDLSIAPISNPKQAARTADLFATRAFACGDRKLYATAAACSDSSSMDVEGTLTLARLGSDGEDDVMIATDLAVHGTLEVPGLNLSGVELFLEYEGGNATLYSRAGKAFTFGSFWAMAFGPDKLSISGTGPRP